MLESVASTKLEKQHNIHPEQKLKTFLSMMMNNIDYQMLPNIFHEGKDVHYHP
jgi:hypothetical protein